jgi:STE24 endopeptidase
MQILAALLLGWTLLFSPLALATPGSGAVAALQDEAWLARARAYQRARLLLFFASLALTPLLIWIFLRLGWSAALRSWLEARGLTNPWLLVAAYTTIVLVLGSLASLPLDFLGLSLRRAFGLSQETTPAWLVRQGKGLLVGLVIALIMVEGLYLLLRSLPRTWWLWGGLGAMLFSLALTYLWPIVVTPLFYTQRPLEDEVLRARILELAQRAGVQVENVYVLNASSTGNEGNAYFTGIGGATRIVLYDTLRDNYPQDEVAVVLAHELGHWRHQHVWKGLLLGGALTLAGLLLGHLLLGRLLPAYGIRGLADVAGLPLLVLLATLGSTLILPGQMWLSRQWEREADRFALQATGDPDAFIRSFERLARQNLSDPTPPPLIEALFYSHPSVAHRLEAAREYARQTR